MIIVKPTQAGILQAVRVIKKGGVIVYPTDTAYALGGIFNFKKVNAKILKIKKRKDDKFTLIAADLSQVRKFFKLNQNQKKLAKECWPGPLSLVISRRFAVRVPKNLVALKLAKLAGRPIIATSANLAGGKTPYRVSEAIKQFANQKNQPDLIIDAGQLAKRKVSTVVKITKNKIEILRAGEIKIKSLWPAGENK
ncbi:MAG: L-threonylcarbamoyladenylate synthase [Candidatus Buchananbacteria bacterium]